MKNEKRYVPPHKVINFDESNPEEMMLFHLLDKTRYYQSKFIKCLLRDFYNDFNITENTPFDDVVYIVKSYINKDESLSKYQILSQIINRGASGSSVPFQQTPIAVSSLASAKIPQSQSDSNLTSDITSEENDDNNYGELASAFDSFLN